jgi:hypothetical protein
MAYMSQEKKRLLAQQIKAVLKKYGMSGTLSVRYHSSLVLTLTMGPIDFDNATGVNVYWIDKHFEGEPRIFLTEVHDAMMGCEAIQNHDNSDIQSDYFDVGWYTDINIGRYGSPYQLTKGE